MTLRETCNALKALEALRDEVYWTTPWNLSPLHTTCGRCGAGRRSHRALHMVHAMRRVAFKRARRTGRPMLLEAIGLLKDETNAFGSCLFVPRWATLLGVRRVNDAPT